VRCIWDRDRTTPAWHDQPTQHDSQATPTSGLGSGNASRICCRMPCRASVERSTASHRTSTGTPGTGSEVRTPSERACCEGCVRGCVDLSLAGMMSGTRVAEAGQFFVRHGEIVSDSWKRGRNEPARMKERERERSIAHPSSAWRGKTHLRFMSSCAAVSPVAVPAIWSTEAVMHPRTQSRSRSQRREPPSG
jgi:hypothetical protein